MYLQASIYYETTNTIILDRFLVEPHAVLPLYAHTKAIYRFKCCRDKANRDRGAHQQQEKKGRQEEGKRRK